MKVSKEYGMVFEVFFLVLVLLEVPLAKLETVDVYRILEDSFNHDGLWDAQIDFLYFIKGYLLLF